MNTLSKLVQENRGTKPAPLKDMARLHQSLTSLLSSIHESILKEISKVPHLVVHTNTVSQKPKCRISEKVYPGVNNEEKSFPGTVPDYFAFL